MLFTERNRQREEDDADADDAKRRRGDGNDDDTLGCATLKCVSCKMHVCVRRAVKQKSAPGAITRQQGRAIKEIAPDPLLDSRIWPGELNVLPCALLYRHKSRRMEFILKRLGAQQAGWVRAPMRWAWYLCVRLCAGGCAIVGSLQWVCTDLGNAS